MRFFKKENGVVSLEASISVTIFLFLMLFLYSFFVVFEARNDMAHAVLATCDSLALDPYESGKHSNSGDLSQVLYAIYGAVSGDANGFYSTADWANVRNFGFDETSWDGAIYVEGTDESNLLPDDFGNAATTSSTLKSVIEERFLAYFAGGSVAEANKILEHYNVVGGWSGLDFSESKVASGKISIKVKYTMEYEFNMFGLGVVEMEHSASSKIWK